ncbi:MAG TPA: hypothetical protein VFG22_12750 [Polyangiales bacterium]|jgi:hypothetical protein|nr:hypothetical protein [Polyangiales bacterium]
MQDFTRPSGRLRALPLGARAVYTVFLVFTLLGLALTLWLTHDMVGIDLKGVTEYYGGGATPIAEVEVESGPALFLPPGGDDLAAFEPMPRRKLLEITHFHLFSMPVYLLILSHMYMLSRSRKTAKAAWIGVGSFGTLLHIAAPWLVAQASVGALASYAISGAMLFISYSVMSVVPLWEMWRR